MPRLIDADSFAGGGGASLGIETALGKPVDIAIDHDPEAIAMLAAVTHRRATDPDRSAHPPRKAGAQRPD